MINIGIGVAWAKSLYSVANNIIANFRARVLSYPNSIFEAGPCLDATLEELNAVGLLDDASLIVTPNAYNEGVLYDVIPNTPLGDMDVVRATTATRVNSAGLIEVVPRNLFTNSQQIDTADWVRQGVSATANQAISPNGTLTAELLDDGTAASTQHWIFQNPSLLNGTTYTISFYAKYISRKFMAVNIFNGLASQYVYYNIQDGLVSGSTGDVTASITSVGNGWFRIVYTRPMATSGSAPNFRIAFADDTSNITYTGSNKQAYVWGFQLENFATATEYFPTTTRLNIPRIDYTNGSCPSLLVEPQRTNISAYLESGTAGFSAATVVSAPSILGLNSFKVTTNTLLFSDNPYINTNSQFQANTAYTLSLYTDFSKCTGTSLTLSFLGLFTGFSSASMIINKTTKVITTSVSGTNWTINTTSATQINGNIYKLIFTATPNATATAASRTYINTNDLFSLEVSGVQVEVGTYPTSFISKPSGASVTRNADVISKTGISSLIGQTEGTIFVEANLSVNVNERRLVTVSNGNEIQRIFIWTIGTSLWASFNSGSISLGNFPIGTAKIAVGYTISGSDTTYSIKVNNNSLVTGTTANAPNSLNTINLGSTAVGALQLNDRINSVQLYKTRLSNSELAQLTTL